MMRIKIETSQSNTLDYHSKDTIYGSLNGQKFCSKALLSMLACSETFAADPLQKQIL